MHVTQIFSYTSCNMANTATLPKNNQYSSIKLKSPLSSDTVSFGATPENNSWFLYAIGQNYDSAESSLITAAKKYHETLAKVCESLSEEGFTYDSVYNSANQVKKKQSVLQKFERNSIPTDIIRGTVYWPNQSDISALKKFIDAMKKEGYVVQTENKFDEQLQDYVRNPETGAIIKFPDVEIRQSGVTKEDLSIMGEVFQRAKITNPRESGYSDYQIRFIPANCPKGAVKRPHELLFLYGPQYAKAKELEHTYVYEITRLYKTFKLDTDPKHYEPNSPGQRFANDLEKIKNLLINFISKPLFENAKNSDLKTGNIKIPVEISRSYAVAINNFANEAKRMIPKCHHNLKKEILSNEAIKKVIEGSPEYQIRENKEITLREIREKRAEILSNIKDGQDSDIDVMNEIIAGIKKTLAKYEEK